MSIPGPDRTSRQGRTFCEHGVDIAATCYGCRRELMTPPEDGVSVWTTRRGARWTVDTRDGRSCALAVIAMVLMYVAIAAALWL